jgi:hypothetical protein
MVLSTVAVVLLLFAVVAAVILIATEAGIPSETAVPVLVVALLAWRSAARHHAAS